MMLSLFLGGILSACSRDVHEHPELTTGKQLFDYHCSDCHGVSGEGKFLKGVPANRDTNLQTVQITHKIREGDSGRMPKFDSMPPQEARKIALYLKRIP